MVHKTVQLHIAKAPGIRHLSQHIRNGVRHQDTHVDLLPLGEFRKKGLRRLPQVYALPRAGGGDDVLEIHKGQLRENQIVHLVEGGLFQRQVPSPVQIIQ